MEISDRIVQGFSCTSVIRGLLEHDFPLFIRALQFSVVKRTLT